MNFLFDKLDAWGLSPLDALNEQPIVSRTDVEDLERMFGYLFPPLYSEFLLRYGIAAFYDSEVAFDAPPDWDEITNHASNDIRAFYGVDKKRPSDIWNLKSVIEGVHLDNLPPHFLPICESDGSPTVVYLSCQEPDYGHLYALTRKQIWDVMNGRLSTEQVERAAFHLANSFEEFLENLRVESFDDLEG